MAGRSAFLLGLLSALACAPPLPPERVERLEIRGASRSQIVAGGETRPGFRLEVPFESRICADAPQGGRSFFELSARASGAGAELRLRHASGLASVGRLDEDWRELYLPIPEGGSPCAVLELSGEPGTEATVSVPLFVDGEARRPWVVLYVVDTFRFDRTPFAAEAELGPALLEFAQDAALYTRAFTSSSWTRPAVATILTGLPPAAHRVYDRQDSLAADVPRLSEWLAEAGWHTAAFSTNPNILPVWGFLPGFDCFADIGTGEWFKWAGFGELGAKVEAFVRQHADRPVFLYVHDNEPHVPYLPGPHYRELFGTVAPGHGAERLQDAGDPASVAAARRLYDAEIRSTSDRFGSLLDALREVGRYEESLIVLVGDHGEEFGDHGDLYHGRTVYQEQLHVPLVVKVPGGRGGLRSERPVSIVDVAPTILALLGEDRVPALRGGVLPGLGGASAGEEDSSDPRPLFAELDLDGRRAAAVVRWPWKYVWVGGGGESLFHLGRDPREGVDEAAARPKLVDALRRDLEQYRARHRSGLVLSCVGGKVEEAGAELVLALGEGASEAAPEVLGLEEWDRLESGEGTVRAALRLRASREDPVGRIMPVRAARAQADRDRVQIPVSPGARVGVSLRALPDLATVHLEGPGGAALSADGRPRPVRDLLAADGLTDPEAGSEAVCRLSYIEPRREAIPEEEIAPGLRERLRALGYLE